MFLRSLSNSSSAANFRRRRRQERLPRSFAAPTIFPSGGNPPSPRLSGDSDRFRLAVRAPPLGDIDRHRLLVSGHLFDLLLPHRRSLARELLCAGPRRKSTCGPGSPGPSRSGSQRRGRCYVLYERPGRLFVFWRLGYGVGVPPDRGPLAHLLGPAHDLDLPGSLGSHDPRVQPHTAAEYCELVVDELDHVVECSPGLRRVALETELLGKRRRLDRWSAGQGWLGPVGVQQSRRLSAPTAGRRTCRPGRSGWGTYQARCKFLARGHQVVPRPTVGGYRDTRFLEHLRVYPAAISVVVRGQVVSGATLRDDRFVPSQEVGVFVSEVRGESSLVPLDELVKRRHDTLGDEEALDVDRRPGECRIGRPPSAGSQRRRRWTRSTPLSARRRFLCWGIPYWSRQR